MTQSKNPENLCTTPKHTRARAGTPLRASLATNHHRSMSRRERERPIYCEIIRDEPTTGAAWSADLNAKQKLWHFDRGFLDDALKPSGPQCPDKPYSC